jgi:hypothetical protein
MGFDLPMPDIHYDGTEGELYDLRHDPRLPVEAPA